VTIITIIVVNVKVEKNSIKVLQTQYISHKNHTIQSNKTAKTDKEKIYVAKISGIWRDVMHNSFGHVI
jgi:hypothetical protein